MAKQRILTDLEVSGTAKISSTIEVRGVVIDPFGATNLMTLTYLADQQKFVARAPTVSGGSGSGDEGSSAMIASWMMGSN